MSAPLADWDTSSDEALYLGSLLQWLDALGYRDHDKLIAALSSGVDSDWFQDRNHRTLHEAILTASLELARPGVAVRIGAVIAEAQRLSGEAAWVRPTIAAVSNAVDRLDLDRLQAEVIPRWWAKLKRRAVRDLIGRVDQQFLLPPTPERFADIDRQLCEAIDRWRAEPELQATGQGPFDKFLADLQVPRPQESFIPTGLACLDDALGGGLSGPGASTPGRVIVVAARPGQGKTLLTGTMATQVAGAGHGVLLFSMEMGVEQMVARLTAARHLLQSGWQVGHPFLNSEHVTYADLIARDFRRLSPEAYDRIFDGGHQIVQDNLTILTKAYTPEALAKQMRLHKQRHPDLRLVIVDHLGLLDISGDNRAAAVGEASRIIKTTAVELGVDVLLVSQLNRGVESRENKMPGMADLRDSGCVEQDADVILGLLRPAYYRPDADPREMQIGILKNRQGHCGLMQATVVLDCCAVLDGAN